MSGILDRLANIRFDLPIALDQWANTRFGDHPAPSTITASQLNHSELSSNIPIPSMQLPIINLPSNLQQDPSLNPPNPPQPIPSPLSQRTVAKIWKEFIHSSSSGEEAESAPADNVVSGAVSVKIETVNDVSANWPSEEASLNGPQPMETDGQTDQMKIDEPEPTNAASLDFHCDAIGAFEPSVVDDPIEDSEIPPSLAEDPICNDNEATSEAVQTNNPIAINVLVTPEIDQPKVDDDHPMSDAEVNHTELDNTGIDYVDGLNRNEATVGNLDMRVISMPIVPPQDPVATQQTQQCPHSVIREDTIEHPSHAITTVNVIPPTPDATQGTLRPSPSIITDMTVHPPPGLLVEDVTSRPSSDSGGGTTGNTLRPGPITRSRSGSHSTGSEPVSRPPSVSPSKKSKSKGRKVK